MLERFSSSFDDEPSSRRVYSVAALLGLAVYVIAYGPAHAFATSDYWRFPQQDERMALMGYRYFLFEPWHWPTFVSDAVNVPYPKSVAFLDCIPLWALVNKAVATVIPSWKAISSHAYLATWHLLTYALQPVLAVAVMRTLGHRRWRDAIVTALFFVAVPAWIFRYGHPALSAHWIELWAILLYLRTPVACAVPRRLGLTWIALLVVATLVTPYHAVLCLPVFAAAMLRARQRSVGAWVAGALGCVVLGLWFAGYFAGEGRRPQWGFEHEGANMLGWLVPTHSGVLGDARSIIDVDPTGYQWEGYAYLGIGFLALLVILLVRRELELRRALRAHRWLVAVLAGFCLVSLSNHIYVGGHKLLSYPIPKLLEWFPKQYRSPGRFVWLPMYVLCLFVLHRGLSQLGGTRGRFVLMALAAVQLVDASGDWSHQRSLTSRPQFLMGNQERWRTLVHAHERVLILPPNSCVIGDADGERQDIASMEIQWLTSERAMPINGTYAARPRRWCKSEARDWATIELLPQTLYVVLPQATAVAERFTALGATCAAFDYGRVCSLEHGAIAAALADGLLRPAPSPIAIHYDQPLSVAGAPTSAAWSAPEAGGRWTIDAVAALLLRSDGTPPANVDLHVEVRAPLCSKRTTQDVDVRLNTRLLTTLHFDAATNDPSVARTIELGDADRAALESGPVALVFVPRDIYAMAALKCGDDPRRLGIWVSRVWFSPRP